METKPHKIDDKFISGLRSSIAKLFRFVNEPTKIFSGEEQSIEARDEQFKNWKFFAKKLTSTLSSRFTEIFEFTLLWIDETDQFVTGWEAAWAKVGIFLGGFRPDTENETESQFILYWFAENHVLDECARVLARLTEKPDGALVSLWDLLDEREYRRFVIIREIFLWTTKKIAPPVPYDPDAAMFTKTSSTFAAIQDLLSAFKEWEHSGIKK